MIYTPRRQPPTVSATQRQRNYEWIVWNAAHVRLQGHVNDLAGSGRFEEALDYMQTVVAEHKVAEPDVYGA